LVSHNYESTIDPFNIPILSSLSSSARFSSSQFYDENACPNNISTRDCLSLTLVNLELGLVLLYYYVSYGYEKVTLRFTYTFFIYSGFYYSEDMSLSPSGRLGGGGSSSYLCSMDYACGSKAIYTAELGFILTF